MSERTLRALVGALVIVVALWGITTFFSGGGGAIGASGDIVGFFDGLNAPSIESLHMGGPDGEVDLRRTGGRWTVNGFRADTAAIDRMLDALGGMQVGDLAAANPANHDRMGVSADSAVTFAVQLTGGTRSLLVGKQGPRFGTVYGRLPDEDRVYLIEGDLRAHVRRRIDDWRDKRIVAVDSSRVGRIEVERDGEAYALVRGDSAWTFEDGAEADSVQVRSILIELSSVVASGFVAEGDSLFTAPRGGSNVAYSAAGEILSDVTIGSGTGERWARAAGDSIVYRLSTFRVGRLAPTREAVEPGS